MESTVDGPYAVEVGELGWLVDHDMWVPQNDYTYPVVDLSPEPARSQVYWRPVTGEAPPADLSGWQPLGYVAADQGIFRTSEHVVQPDLEAYTAAFDRLRQILRDRLPGIMEPLRRLGVLNTRGQSPHMVIIDEGREYPAVSDDDQSLADRVAEDVRRATAPEYWPANWEGDAPRPFVIRLHGYDSDGLNFQPRVRFPEHLLASVNPPRTHLRIGSIT
jgi:hypothetical protein